jgi:hypothetical protein
MSQEKYIGMDVHQATISVAVMDASGKLIMECLLETKAATIVEFIQGLHGTLALTFEEGYGRVCPDLIYVRQRNFETALQSPELVSTPNVQYQLAFRYR